MQPNNNGVGAGAPVSVTAPKEDIVFRDKPRKNTGMTIGMIVLALLAAGGIGFGVWAMLEKNQEVATLNEKMSELNEREEIDDGQLDNSSGDATVLSENPIIAAQSPEAYRVFYSLPLFSQSGENNVMTVLVENDGKVSCSISNLPNGGECVISGLPKDVYKVETIFEGNGSGTEKIGFLMRDGSVWYASVYNGDSGNVNMEMQAKKININGFVKDIVPVHYTSDMNAPAGWYYSTVFVKDDNSFVKFNESMFE